MIDDEAARKVRVVLAGEGWNDVIRPAIEKRAAEAMKALRLSPDHRDQIYPVGSPYRRSDEALRVLIDDCEWMAVAFMNELAVHEANRRRDELAAAGQTATNSR